MILLNLILIPSFLFLSLFHSNYLHLMAVVNQIIYSVKEIDFIVYSEKKIEIAYYCIYVCTDLEDLGLKFDCKCFGTLRE